MALIHVENASLGYDKKAVVCDVSFSVQAGDYLCIVGENGSGKSTLMKTMLGLLSPMAGAITFGDGLMQRQIGYLPQQTEVQKDFPASAIEIVLSGCLNRLGLRPFYNRNQKKLANTNMARLGISSLANRCYRELSGGQQQRILLARALCATQRLLLLDEPVAGLDPKATADMYTMIERLNKEDKITVMMVSHDMKAAIRYASHILHIANRPLFFGSKEDYLQTDIGKAAALQFGGGAE